MPRISLPPFLKKLQAVCLDVDPKVASWSVDGNTFIVHSSTVFEQFLGAYFKGSLLTFIRQLHFYGFRKVDIKGEKWSFSHKCFRRDYPHLVYEIRRKTRTETNDGIASQLEVQALRDHVGSLHDMITKLQNELRETRAEISELKLGRKRALEEAEMRQETSKKKVVVRPEGKKLSEVPIQFDTLAGIFDGEGFFGDGYDAILPFAESSMGDQKTRPM